MQPRWRTQPPERDEAFVRHAVDRQGHQPFLGRVQDNRSPAAKLGETALDSDLLDGAKQSRRITPSHVTHARLASRAQPEPRQPNKNAPFIPSAKSF
jgi:hypothetical protein